MLNIFNFMDFKSGIETILAKLSFPNLIWRLKKSSSRPKLGLTNHHPLFQCLDLSRLFDNQKYHGLSLGNKSIIAFEWCALFVFFEYLTIFYYSFGYHASSHMFFQCFQHLFTSSYKCIKVVVPSPNTLSWDATSMTHLETHSPMHLK